MPNNPRSNIIQRTSRAFILWWTVCIVLRQNVVVFCHSESTLYVYHPVTGSHTFLLRYIKLCLNALRPSDAYMRKLTIIGSDNGLSHGRHQAIIWTDAVILLIKPLGINLNVVLIEMYTFSWKNDLKKSSGIWRTFCLGLNELMALVCAVYHGRCWHTNDHNESYMEKYRALVST